MSHLSSSDAAWMFTCSLGFKMTFLFSGSESKYTLSLAVVCHSYTSRKASDSYIMIGIDLLQLLLFYIVNLLATMYLSFFCNSWINQTAECEGSACINDAPPSPLH